MTSPDLDLGDPGTGAGEGRNPGRAGQVGWSFLPSSVPVSRSFWNPLGQVALVLPSRRLPLVACLRTGFGFSLFGGVSVCAGLRCVDRRATSSPRRESQAFVVRRTQDVRESSDFV